MTEISGRGVGLDVVQDGRAAPGDGRRPLRAGGAGRASTSRCRSRCPRPRRCCFRVGRDVVAIPAETSSACSCSGTAISARSQAARPRGSAASTLPYAPLGRLLADRGGAGAPAAPHRRWCSRRAAQRVAVGVDEVSVSRRWWSRRSARGRAAQVEHLAGAAVLDDGRVVADPLRGGARPARAAGGGGAGAGSRLRAARPRRRRLAHHPLRDEGAPRDRRVRGRPRRGRRGGAPAPARVGRGPRRLGRADAPARRPRPRARA